jgi:mediator of RNA polymerase II transcription subunit 17, fungi type
LSQQIKALNIPPGSFGVSKQRVVPVDESETRKQELVAKGSRNDVLQSAVDRILKAATKLETEVRKETKYWEEVLSISEKGWCLTPLRKNTPYTPLAVRYGYNEGVLNPICYFCMS